jgi:hypothetical protein
VLLVPPEPIPQHPEEAVPLDAIENPQTEAPSSQYCWTLANVFGLSKKYYGRQLLESSPDDYLTLHDLSNDHPDDQTPASTSSNPPTEYASFFPYPNKNSLALGDWYWNHGVQKSQASFKALIDIVGNPDFKPEDVAKTNWGEINKILASNPTQSSGDSGPEWLGDGWDTSTIEITVPFHQRMKDPGPQSYTVGELHHRSIVSVVKQRLESSSHGIHFEPHELFWKLNEDSEGFRVYGETYTSDAFLDMHRELLDSPPEPGCNAPRFIIPLMFWSDATLLTSFGQAKLWPLYMYFASDSKYRRCKPSANLCNHIAYFQKVNLPDCYLVNG